MREGITFRVGQVVRHKKFDYRGVIIGWDRRPTVDVSRWDGLVGLPSKEEQVNEVETRGWSLGPQWMPAADTGSALWVQCASGASLSIM